MTVYVDSPTDYGDLVKGYARRHGTRWSHLWADDVDELHAFAAKIGIMRKWFQDRPRLPHYDIIPRKRWRALALGARKMEVIDWLRQMRRSTTMKLPDTLKSGRRRIARTEAGHGLYKADGQQDDAYRIVYPNRSVHRGEIGPKGWPSAPDGLRWKFRKGERPRQRHKLSKRDRQRSDNEALTQRVTSAVAKNPERPLSMVNICMECGVDVRSKKHAHSTLDDLGFPATICCRCVRKRGLTCSIRQAAVKEREQAGRRPGRSRPR